jgi:hypothetical protein
LTASVFMMVDAAECAIWLEWRKGKQRPLAGMSHNS